MIVLVMLAVFIGTMAIADEMAKKRVLSESRGTDMRALGDRVVAEAADVLWRERRQDELARWNGWMGPVYTPDRGA